MSGRRERQLRAERARHAGQRATTQRRRVGVIWGAAGGAALVLVALVVVLVNASGGGGGSTASVATAGLQSTPAPWAPEYAHLQLRLASLSLPPNGDERYHVHALLHVYVDGQPVVVPANMGIDLSHGIETPMHTHNTTGVIHIEASQPSNAFTLGALFDIWGVTFTAHQLGSYKDGGGKFVQVWVDGKQVGNPVSYAIQRHDNIVVAYGTEGSFPTSPPADALKGI